MEITCAEDMLRRPVTFWAGEWVGWSSRRFGSVVRSPFYTYVLDPELAAAAFSRSADFSWWEAFKLLAPIDGATSMLMSDGDEHARRRRLVQPAFHRRRVDGYVSTMVKLTDDMIDGWQPGERVELYSALKSSLRRITLSTLFGPLATDDARIGRDIEDLTAVADGLPSQMAWRRRLGTPTWRRGMAARARLVDRLDSEIARVRHEGQNEDTVLAALVHGRDEDGAALTQEEIRDQVITLIIAGHETTSAATAWAVYLLLTNPDTWAAAHAEVMTVLDGRPPTASDVARLPYLGGAVQESLRLVPPAWSVPRWAVADMRLGDVDIRRGTYLILSPYVTHRRADLWPDPLRFAPQRWNPSDPLFRKPKRGTYLPFGGGSHRCVGSTMATTELTVLLARLLARTALFLPSQRVRAQGLITVRPSTLWVEAG